MRFNQLARWITAPALGLALAVTMAACSSSSSSSATAEPSSAASAASSPSAAPSAPAGDVWPTSIGFVSALPAQSESGRVSRPQELRSRVADRLA